MTKLIQRMREELVRRNFAESTMRTYLQVVEDFRRYSPTRLDRRGPDDIRRYLGFLQSVEAQRKDYEGKLTNKMLAAVPNFMAPDFSNENVQPPDQQLVQQYSQMAQEYAQATVRFQTASQQIVVPAACRKRSRSSDRLCPPCLQGTTAARGYRTRLPRPAAQPAQKRATP